MIKTTQRNAASLREAARIMREGGCVVAVLRGLQICAMTGPELCRVLGGKYRPRTIYGAIQRLRTAGLIVASKKVCLPGFGWAQLWRAV